MTAFKLAFTFVIISVFALVMTSCGNEQGHCFYLCDDGRAGCGAAQADQWGECTGSAERSCGDSAVVESVFLGDCDCDSSCAPSWF